MKYFLLILLVAVVSFCSCQSHRVKFTIVRDGDSTVNLLNYNVKYYLVTKTDTINIIDGEYVTKPSNINYEQILKSMIVIQLDTLIVMDCEKVDNSSMPELVKEAVRPNYKYCFENLKEFYLTIDYYPFESNDAKNIVTTKAEMEKRGARDYVVYIFHTREYEYQVCHFK